VEEKQKFPENISKREYLKKHAGKKFYKKLNILGIVGYCLFVIFVVLQLWLPITPLERLIYLGLLIGVHAGKSWVCAVLLVLFGMFSFIVGSLVAGSVNYLGAAALGIGIAALCLITKAHRQYELLQKQSVLE